MGVSCSQVDHWRAVRGAGIALQYVPVIALLISVASLAISYAAFKVQRRRTNMELARSLHFDLTSGEVAMARESLGTLTRDLKVIASGDSAKRNAWFVAARTDYFTLLWCFERIWAGRVTIMADEGRRHTGPARRYLDGLIGWHVRSWALDLPEIKEVLEDELDSPVLDQDSSRAFGKLSGALLSSDEKARLVQSLSSRGLEPTGYSEWQT